MSADIVFHRSRRLWFRAPEETDIPVITRWVNNPAVREFLDTRVYPFSQIVEKDWLRTTLVNPTGPAPSQFILLFGPEGDETPIGSTGFMTINWVVRSAEFGILIGDQSHWDQGYGTEVTEMMVNHAFESLNLNRLMLRVNVENPRAQRAYEKVGFQLEGRLRQASLVHGKPADILIMSILRSEWEARRSAQA